MGFISVENGVADNHKTLILMRHGKSDWHSITARDIGRPLAGRGLRDSPRMGQWLARQVGTPDKIVCSPAQRTVATAECVAESTGLPVAAIIHDDAIYEAGRADLLAAIERHAEKTRTLLLVGHNPALDAVLEYLSDSRPPLTKSGKLMTTAAIAILACPSWPLHKGGCSLQSLMRPKQLPQAHEPG